MPNYDNFLDFVLDRLHAKELVKTIRITRFLVNQVRDVEKQKSVYFDYFSGTSC